MEILILKTMRTITTTLALLTIGFAATAQNTYGDIIGTFVDGKTKEPIWGATVMTTRGEELFREQTDIDGRFRMSAVPAGTYTVMFVWEKDTTTAIADVAPDGFGDVGTVRYIATPDPADSGNVAKATDIEDIEVLGNRITLRKGVAPEIKMTSKEVKLSVSKFDVKGMVTGMTSDVRQTEDGSLVFRGARKGDLIYYIDGVKLNETFNVPSSAINYIMVYSGAIPAKYGDTNGGVIVVETKSYFDMLREYNNRISLGE
jgi:hypothetical protein